MAQIIKKPTIIEAAGIKHKIIEEFVGRVNTKNNDISIAHMKSPVGWEEPGQKPEFEEYTVVVRGCLQVETKEQTYLLDAGQAIHTQKDEWVRYSTPFEGGAEYIAVCLPAFSADKVNRDS